ncbi:MAG: HAD family phosphatase [Anaerolineae bacterium]|nr:HAD family phosphatase [Anaerolineae bacterium]
MSLRLAIFDLDGTLKQARDPYVYLHQRLGTWEVAQTFFDQGVSGQLPYSEWLRLDASLWKGVSRAAMEAFFRDNPYLPGARETVGALRQAGVRVAVISTGLNVHAELVQAELGLDWIIANELLFEDGCATGAARERVPEGGKGQIVEQLQAELGVQPADCLAVGDSTSDVAMFARSRIGVAINPSSDQVRSAANLVLDPPDLWPLLPRLRETVPGWLSL